MRAPGKSDFSSCTAKKDSKIQDGALMSSSLLLRNILIGVLDTFLSHFFSALKFELVYAKDAGIYEKGVERGEGGWNTVVWSEEELYLAPRREGSSLIIIKRLIYHLYYLPFAFICSVVILI